MLLVSGSISSIQGRSSEKLPGRSVRFEQLPDGVKRFAKNHFNYPNHLSYRFAKPSYYVYDTTGGYFQLTEGGALEGFRCILRQPSQEILDLLPQGVITHIRAHCHGYFLNAFLPEGDGFRAEFFGDRDRCLRFDREGHYLGEE